MIVLLSGDSARDYPAIIEAARCLPKAKALGCDRIRVEKLDGARVADFPIGTVERFLAHYRLALQPDRLIRRDRDWEYRRPVVPGWTPAPAAGQGE